MKNPLKLSPWLLGLVGVALVGCTQSAEELATTEGAVEANQVTFECADGQSFTAAFTTETVTFTLPEQGEITLPRAEAASGAKYSDGTTTLWNKGTEAYVEVNGERVLSDCNQAE